MKTQALDRQLFERHTRRLAAWLEPAGPSTDALPRDDTTWKQFTDDVRRMGLCGLILEKAEVREATLPAGCAKELRSSAMAVAALNLHLMRELERVVRVLDEGDVAVMLLKGAALNLTTYDRPDLRPMSDLDLLVSPRDADQAVRLLLQHGCRRGQDLVREDFFPKYHYEVELLTGSPRPARIDLHVRGLRPLRISRTMPDDALWYEAQVIRLGEAEAFIPRPELMFMHLTAHAAYHGCSRLRWLYDIRRFVDRFGFAMDWKLMAEQAAQWRLSLAVTEAIRRATILFGPVCPLDAVRELESHSTNWRDRLTLRQAPRDSASPIANVLCNLLCTPGLRFRLGYAAAMLLPGEQHMMGVYPWRHRGWILCAHAARVFRVFGRALSTLFHVLTGVGRRGHRITLRKRPVGSAVS